MHTIRALSVLLLDRITCFCGRTDASGVRHSVSEAESMLSFIMLETDLVSLVQLYCSGSLHMKHIGRQRIIASRNAPRTFRIVPLLR